MNIPNYTHKFEKYLLEQISKKQPEKLYDPIRYILKTGGKRIRPVLTLMAAKTYGYNIKKAFPAATAIEIFHNFTLLHDDIMDQADIRRGKPSVHKKWNENIAILSGDAMMILAFQMLNKYDGETFKKLTLLLSKTGIEICEGQQMDMDFETQTEVSIDEYLEMIRLKTAVLLGTALSFGGILANIPEGNLKNLYSFGESLGIAFQIQDDYLDSFGDVKHFGKKIGGDIIDRKKTFLFITAYQQASPTDRGLLNKLFAEKDIAHNDLIAQTLEIYKKYKIPEITSKAIEKYTKKSFDYLQNSGMQPNEIEKWKTFALDLMNRQK